jgi:hypothetical protein
VGRRIVPDHKRAFARDLFEMLEDLDRVRTVQRLLPNQGVDLARGRHAAHDHLLQRITDAYGK